MTPDQVLAQARRLGIRIVAKNGRLAITPASRAPAEFVEAVRRHKPELLAILEVPAQEARLEADVVEHGNVAAVLLESPVYGQVWLVADTDALDEHPDIEASGLPVLFFADVEALKRLRGHEDAIKRFLLVKRAFPRARVVQ